MTPCCGLEVLEDAVEDHRQQRVLGERAGHRLVHVAQRLQPQRVAAQRLGAVEPLGRGADLLLEQLGGGTEDGGADAAVVGGGGRDRGAVAGERDRAGREADDVAGPDRRQALDRRVVDEGAVARAEVLDQELVVAAGQPRVVAREERVLERQVGGRGASDRDRLSVEDEVERIAFGGCDAEPHTNEKSYHALGLASASVAGPHCCSSGGSRMALALGPASLGARTAEPPNHDRQEPDRWRTPTKSCPS